MFDTHITHLSNSPNSVHVTVNEKRSPTDESVKLLMEMEKKAQEKIDKSIRLNSTNIDVVIHSYQDFNDQFIHFRIHYMLNGVRRTVVHAVPMHLVDDEEGIAKALLKALSEDIALNLLSESELSLRDLLRN